MMVRIRNEDHEIWLNSDQFEMVLIDKGGIKITVGGERPTTWVVDEASKEGFIKWLHGSNQIHYGTVEFR